MNGGELYYVIRLAMKIHERLLQAAAPQKIPGREMTPSRMGEHDHPLATLNDPGLDVLLKRAIRITLTSVGFICALFLWKASGWRNAAMMKRERQSRPPTYWSGGGSVHYINAKLRNKPGRGLGWPSSFCVLRLMLFAGAMLS